MNQNRYYSIGIDVGGTNTDAVIIQHPSKKIVNWTKVPTTKDFSTGILQSIKKVLTSQNQINENYIGSIMLGTTTFLNAILECSPELMPVTVIRLCGQATKQFPPFINFPQRLAKHLKSKCYYVDGGFEYDKSVICKLDQMRIREIVQQMAKEYQNQTKKLSIVVIGVFAPVCSNQQERTKEIIIQQFTKFGIKDYNLTLSHKIAQIGFLEREGASILNASLKNLANKTIKNLKKQLQRLNLTNCQDNIYLTQNDGTLITCEYAIQYPIFTFNSGPTNSLRGASQLTNFKDAIVADIGGTSTDIAVLKNGFPRLASSYIQVAGIRTNFSMPDTVSIALGGGSIVKFENDKCIIGPTSVGYRLLKQSKSFNGSILTTTDIAIGRGIASFNNSDINKINLTKQELEIAQKQIYKKIQNIIDKMKISDQPVPLILVGGGSILIQQNAQIKGISKIIKPQFYSVANAFGAGIAQVSGIVDQIITISAKNKQNQIYQVTNKAKKLAISKGAVQSTIEIFKEEIHLAYLPGTAIRVICKAVGDIDPSIFKNLMNIKQKSKILDIKIKQIQPQPFIQSIIQEKNSQLKKQFNNPKIIDNNGRKQWILTEEDLDYMAIGAAILGTGGGGSPYLGKMQVKSIMRKGKKIRIIPPNSLKQNQSLFWVAFYGAPLIMLEKLGGTSKVSSALKTMKQLYPEIQQFCVGCVQIGGLNSLTPLLVAAQLQIPVIDGDFMGRAFPQVQMITPFIYGQKPIPFCMGDEKGNQFVVTNIQNNNPKNLQTFLRKNAILLGCDTGVCGPPLNKLQVEKYLIPNSLSHIWRLGRDILEARQLKINPLKIIQQKEGGKLLFKGKIVDLTRITQSGYNKDTQTYEPILVEDLKYGLRVSVLFLPVNDKMKTKEAMKLVSPQAFGYKQFEYNSLGNYHIPKSVFDN